MTHIMKVYLSRAICNAAMSLIYYGVACRHICWQHKAEVKDVAAGNDQSRLSCLLMADWITRFSNQVEKELLSSCQEAYARWGEQAATPGALPSRESALGTDVIFDSDIHPVPSSSQALLHIQVLMILLIVRPLFSLSPILPDMALTNGLSSFMLGLPA